MKTNTKPDPYLEKTHEGAPAARMTPEQALRRSVMSCMLWEREFYEDGEEIADRIRKLANAVDLETLAALAIEVRKQGKLRHVPLFLLACLVNRAGGPSVATAIAETISRADELAEFVSIYWSLNADKAKPPKHAPIPAQMKKGLARAFLKFDEYQLAKYDRPNAVRLRDVLRLCHAKPDTPERAALWKRLLDGKLATPDTWEVALSGGADKKETFERLLREGKLGYLALLRNLRNMQQAGVDPAPVMRAILARKGGAHNVLPFRFVAAARAAPQFEMVLDAALVANVGMSAKLTGRTVVLVDVSGSMNVKLSAKSDLTRMDAAATLASVINAESMRVFTFSDTLREGPPRVGMAGVDSIKGSQPHHGTNLFGALRGLVLHNVQGERLIVITDEQTNTSRPAVTPPFGNFAGNLGGGVPEPAFKRRYMINVASAKNGIGYGKGWTHIDGFSESVLRFIAEYEKDTP